MTCRGRSALVLMVVFAGLGLESCGRSHDSAAAESDAARRSAEPAAPGLEDLRVEYRSVEIPAHMAPGSQANVRFEAKNVGTRPWPSGGDFSLRFGYHWEAPGEDGNWAVVVWDDSNRAGLPADVQPGSTVTVTLPVRAVVHPCPNCRLVIAPLLERKAWSETAKSIATVNVS